MSYRLNSSPIQLHPIQLSRPQFFLTNTLDYKATQLSSAKTGDIQTDNLSSDSSDPSVSGTTNNSSTIPVTTMVNRYQPNADLNDAAYWKRASSSLYIEAQTRAPLSQINGSSLLQLQPLQTVYLITYSLTQNVTPSDATWIVNSPDAHITSEMNHWQQGKFQVAVGEFVATVPGIYTVQTYANGVFSVPLVLVVGQSKLNHIPFSIPSIQTGIQPLSINLPVIKPITKAGVTYDQYLPEGNWIPISGTTDPKLSMMTVLLNSSNGQSWSYRLPIVNGKFSAMVESPFAGMVYVTLFPDFFKELTQSVEKNTGLITPASIYSLQISGNTLNALATSELPSAYRDYNVSPKFASVASTLLENSPSTDTAIAAIANYASSAITYNQKEVILINYLWQDAWTAWQSGSGICEDYSNLAASLMQSVGIPVQIIQGAANGNWTTPPSADSNPEDSHQWNQAWDGSQWIVYDPTWATDDFSSVPDYLTNQFFTNTLSLQATHLTYPSTIGLDYAWR